MPRSVAGPFIPQLSSFFLAIRPLSPPSPFDSAPPSLFSPVCLSPRRENSRNVCSTCYSSNYATCGRDRAARQHEKPFVVGFQTREFVAAERTGDRPRGEGGQKGRKHGDWSTKGIPKGRDGWCIPTLRMHPRNPFLAYIHFRCDKVERARERERGGREERQRKIGLVAGREVKETAQADTK